MISEVIPQDYIVEKFFQYAGYPKYKKITNVYEGGCPLCREGKSWGKKRRLYFVAKENYIYCHNCGWSGSPINWVQEVTGKNYIEIINECKEFNTFTIPEEKVNPLIPEKPPESLPGDCINLYDKLQYSFYNHEAMVTHAINTCKNRRLFTAINKPKSLWFCRDDFVHKNRIILPFYENKNIIFYQSRKLEQNKKDKKPKYLSKIGADKTIFNFDNITNELDYIFIFEGPIDSFFVRNGVAVGGISKGRSCFTKRQEKQIQQYPFHKRIWVLDNQWCDETAKEKTKSLLGQGEECFIWPKEFKQYKDFNDICIKINRDKISSRFIIKNSYNELKGKLLLSQI